MILLQFKAYTTRLTFKTHKNEIELLLQYFDYLKKYQQLFTRKIKFKNL